MAADMRMSLAALLDAAALSPGDCVVIGCSTSEALGARIGTGGSPELAAALCEAALAETSGRGLYVAAQCCEHLNRALVTPRDYAQRQGLTEVWAVPQPHAGGSFAAHMYQLLPDAVLVQSVRAGAGLDIGQTLIGMHLRPVAVPVRGPIAAIGAAVLTMARSRPPLIGGIRARYERGDGTSPYR